MSTSATRRILHITTDNLSDLKEKQFGNALSANADYHTTNKRTDWGAKDIYGDVQTFAALDSVVSFDKIYLGGDSSKIITISTLISEDEAAIGTTRATGSINIGMGAGIDMVDDAGHINIGEFAGQGSQGGSAGSGQVINIGFHSGVQSDGQFNINFGNSAAQQMIGNYNINAGAGTSLGLSGDSNVVIGNGALKVTSNGSNYNINNNVVIGQYAAEIPSNSFDHVVAIGYQALASVGIASRAVAIGQGALHNGDGAGDTVAIGTSAGANSNSSGSVFIGKDAGMGETNDARFAIAGAFNTILSGDFLTKEVIVDHVKFPKTTIPATISTQHAYIFASASGAFGLSTELYVVDGQSNITKISPHNELDEWEYYSHNKNTGKTIRINMEGFIRKMEDLTGETFIEEI